MALAVFVTYSLTGGDFTAVPVFVALSMYESTRMSMTAYVCYAITQASEVFISIQRIQVKYCIWASTRDFSAYLLCTKTSYKHPC